MKTAKEIREAIAAKAEAQRKAKVDFAIKKIESTSEEMFKDLNSGMAIPLADASELELFTEALSEPEVEECLQNTAFVLTRFGCEFHLQI